jgi:hypothetical protein
MIVSKNKFGPLTFTVACSAALLTGTTRGAESVGAIPALTGVWERNGLGDLRADSDMRKKGLQVEVTIDDPRMFTTKWTGLVTYRPAVGEWPEAVCNEAPSPTFNMATPVADKPDF